MRLALLLGLAALAATLAAGPAAARTTAVALPDGKPYDINWASIIPRRRVIWVNPASGNDAASGAAPAQALRTLVAAWEQVAGVRCRARWVLQGSAGRREGRAHHSRASTRLPVTACRSPPTSNGPTTL